MEIALMGLCMTCAFIIGAVVANPALLWEKANPTLSQEKFAEEVDKITKEEEKINREWSNLLNFSGESQEVNE